MLGQYICMLFLVCVLCNVLYIRSLVVLVWCYALCACVLCTHISVFLCINFNIMCHVLRFNVIASKFLIFSMCAVGHSHVVVHVWCLYGCAHFVSLVHFHAGGSQIAAQKLYSTCVVSSQMLLSFMYFASILSEAISASNPRNLDNQGITIKFILLLKKCADKIREWVCCPCCCKRDEVEAM